MKLTVTFLFIFFGLASQSQELSSDASTLLLLHFNNNTTGAAGEMPIASSNISYAAGRHGNALQINSSTTLRFDTTQNLNPRQGTIEFWVKPVTTGNTVALDMGVAGGLSVQVGNFTRMIFNIFGINGNPETGVIGNSSIFQLNTWYHLAFTWENRVARIYYNGSLAFSTTISFDFPNVNLNYFNIGSTISGMAQMEGLLDEFRISNRARTADEICQSHLMGQASSGLTNLFARDNSTITLYKTWNIYLHKAGFWKVPSLYSLQGTDTLNIAGACINWTVSDPSIASIDTGVLTAKNMGTTNLIASVAGQSVSIPLQVISPVLAPEALTTIDPLLSTPAACNTITVPVVVIVFLPTLDGVTINTAETGDLPLPQQTLSLGKDHILRINSHAKFSLEEGSKFRGYNNPSALPYVGYKVIDYIYIYEPIPRGFPAPGSGSQNIFFPDYHQILSRMNGKRYVDTLGVKEFWLAYYHHGEIAPDESNMSSPTTGDISNSYRFPDDMPVYSKTYITYGRSMTRGGNESTHNHGHQIESMVAYVAQKQDGNANLFNVNFRGYPSSGSGGPIGRCGDTHHPPNSTSDYDYSNTTFVASDILDWKPSGGVQTMVNSSTWGNINYPWPSSLYPLLPPNAESNWYIMWMQSLPGYGNQIPYTTKWMTNWWRFLADWDSNTVKIGLYQNSPESSPACASSLNSSVAITTACAGSSFQVSYTSTGISFSSGNIFTVQLSDATGSFSNPVAIGTLNAVSTSGMINVTIPPGTSQGNNFLIRVASSSPVFIGSTSNALTINAIPATPVITSGGATTFCSGGSATLTSNAANGNQWYKDGLVITGSTGTSFIATASGSYTVKITLNGCESSASNAIVVTVNPLPPTPVITAGASTTFCTGGSVILTSNVAIGNQWYKDGSIITGSTGTTFNATASGSYSVKVILNGCESSTSNAIAVTVNPIPTTPTITQSGNQLTSSSASGNQWYLNGSSIPGATSQNYSPTASGNYSVQITQNGCASSFSNVINFIVTALPDISAFENEIKVLPNPVTDKVVVLRSSTNPAVLQVQLTDMSGRVLKQLTSSLSRIEIDMEKYAAGIYIISIANKQRNFKGKKMFLKL